MTIALPRLDRSTAADRGLTLADFLVPVRLAERTPTRVRHVVLIVLGAAAVALTAQIYIPTTPVPFTGQTFGVLVVGGALGFRRGAAALAALPRDRGAGRADLRARARPASTSSSGRPAATSSGSSSPRPSSGDWPSSAGIGASARALATMLVGTAIIYAFGVPWLKAATGMSWSESVASGLTPFLVWDMAKLAIAAAIFPTAWWLIGRRPEDR